MSIGEFLIAVVLLIIWIFTRNNIANIIVTMALVAFLVYMIINEPIGTWLQITYEILAGGVTCIGIVRFLRAR